MQDGKETLSLLHTEEKEIRRAVGNRVHGFSLAESLPGKKRSLPVPAGLGQCWRVSGLPLLVSQLCLTDISLH